MTANNYIETLFNSHVLNECRLGGGRNNRVSLFELDQKKIVLKEYYTSEKDKFDRFTKETNFYKHIKKYQIKNTLVLIDSNLDKKINIFEFVEAKKPKQKNINLDLILQCANFINSLNKESSLDNASEACFSIEDHINSVGNRFSSFGFLKNINGVGRKAYKFINDTLYSDFLKEKKDILENENVYMDETKIVSPSDFGFHNSILDKSGKLIFLDFEYGGIDTPYKLICDFFSQPDYEIDSKHIEIFVEKLSLKKSINISTIKRLLSIYRIKWSLIVLNGFLKEGSLRREYATEKTEELSLVLKKAENYYRKNKMNNIDFLSKLHTKTKRDYLARMNEKKAGIIEVAKEYGYDYWDGSRDTGYGGYSYDGRWKSVAQDLIKHYGLKAGDKVLDVGCGKGFLIYDLMNELPGLEVVGIDISEYAIKNAKEEIKPYISIASATELPFEDSSFDLVITLNVLHNLYCYELEKALTEIERVGKKNKYMVVESYRNEQEKVNLMCWVLTGECFFNDDEWLWWLGKAEYTGDYSFIYFE